ncbi:hypothetical protein IC229_01975 [Spirosoma sp. BT702]|uniref:Lipoprotein n=1 Tax=Spirosoma profusum TaxID=2771354 RepID=A0A927AT64_9BACT|nr:hypothetical protein [Spirosoma profusum]MBD2699387.1 hypothetical protein [Spirosoma profusum]
MKRFHSYLGCLILASLVSCKQEKTTPCKAPQRVTVDSECYAGNGLKFTASDYGDTPLSFEWNVVALKDTSRVNGWTPKDEKIRMIASNTFVVPDSLVTNYQRLIVEVAANCQGQLKHSTYYAFVKKRSAATNCVTWASQNSL